MLISGHQRLICLIVMNQENETIDVRYPNRKLTKEELKEYTLLANQQFGDVDFDMLDAFLSDVNLDLEVIGIDMVSFNNSVEEATNDIIDEKRKKGNESRNKTRHDLREFDLTYVLISFPPENILELQKHFEAIIAFDFVNYNQISQSKK